MVCKRYGFLREYKSGDGVPRGRLIPRDGVPRGGLVA